MYYLGDMDDNQAAEEENESKNTYISQARLIFILIHLKVLIFALNESHLLLFINCLIPDNSAASISFTFANPVDVDLDEGEAFVVSI